MIQEPLSCPATRTQLKLLTELAALTKSPTRALEGGLTEKCGDISPNGVLRENKNLPMWQESSKTFEIYIFLKEYTESHISAGGV